MGKPWDNVTRDELVTRAKEKKINVTTSSGKKRSKEELWNELYQVKATKTSGDKSGGKTSDKSSGVSGISKKSKSSTGSKKSKTSKVEKKESKVPVTARDFCEVVTYRHLRQYLAEHDAWDFFTADQLKKIYDFVNTK